MNAPRLTDAQVSQALRAHLPDRAQAGLRERILEAAETTGQQRALPSFLGALSEADPVTRRRSLLIAAALLVALALAATAAVGALRLLERDPFQDLSLEPPADVPAFVLSSYERLPELPPLALTWRDGDGSDKGRIYVDRSGAVRFDRFASAEATEPSSYTILSGNRISGMAPVESEAVWVEPGHEAFGDDPRTWIWTVFNSEEGPGCEMERDPSEVGNGDCGNGLEVRRRRIRRGPPHAPLRVCRRDLARHRDPADPARPGPVTDDAGQPIPGQFGGREVTEITFGEQPAALFEAPEGVAHMTSEAYSAYLCTRDVQTDVEVGFGTGTVHHRKRRRRRRQHARPPSLGPRPSGPAGPLAWTPASLEEDWPAPVRPEPAGGAIVVPLEDPIDGWTIYPDPSGDTGSSVVPWVDIRDVKVGLTKVVFDLVSGMPPSVDPTEQWIAYGVVVDDDRDGVPDWRYGMDNMPVDAPGDERPHRPWRTNLHTGRTESAPGGPYEYVGDTYFDTYFYGGYWGGPTLSFGSDVTGGGTKGGLPDAFYAWAAVIENGRVVATDYAPDVGWLDPPTESKP